LENFCEKRFVYASGKAGCCKPRQHKKISKLYKATIERTFETLPESISRWTDNPKLIPPVCVLSIAFAMVAGHCYSILGEVTLMTGAASYQDAWKKQYTQGPGPVTNLGIACLRSALTLTLAVPTVTFS
jgi:hypothetical protein